MFIKLTEYFLLQYQIRHEGIDGHISNMNLINSLK